MTIISEALKKGQTALSEFQSKQLLAAYAIPICEEYLAHTANDHVKIDMMMDALYCYPQILRGGGRGEHTRGIQLAALTEGPRASDYG